MNEVEKVAAKGGENFVEIQFFITKCDVFNRNTLKSLF